eukprot:6186457-Amphidinium_carterae.1
MDQWKRSDELLRVLEWTRFMGLSACGPSRKDSECIDDRHSTVQLKPRRSKAAQETHSRSNYHQKRHLG